MKIKIKNIKKFDKVLLKSGEHTVDYLLMYKGSDFCRIYYMNKKSTFALIDSDIEIKRDRFYSVCHKQFTNSIINVLQ